MEKEDKPIVALPLPIALGMPFFTLYMANLSVMTQTSSLSTLHST
jgi:hypothetical protein